MEVHEARERLLAARHVGTMCPVCRRNYQTRKRRITGSMAHALIAITKQVEVGHTFHLPTLLEYAAKSEPGWASARQGGDASKLACWNLIGRPLPQKGRRAVAGTWVLTPTGKAFAEGRIGVDEYAIVEARQVIGFEGRKVFLRDVLHGEFSLRDTEMGAGEIR